MIYTTYILGAGFSKPAGAPLGNELLNRILKLSCDKKIGVNQRATLINITETLEELLGELQNRSYEEILTILQNKALFETIIRRDFIEAKQMQKEFIWAGLFAISYLIGINRKKSLYDKFVNLLSPMDAIISLNYDIIVEDALIRKYHQFDTGIPPQYILKPSKHFITYMGIEILKIHGSMNYLKCDNCGKWLTEKQKIAHSILAPFPDGFEAFCECDGQLLPVIVPLSMEKSGALLDVNWFWKKAAYNLRNAKKVIFIGCSLSPADFHFRILLRETIGKRDNTNVSVISSSSKSKKRYEELFPNHRIDFFKDGFEKWISAY